MASFETKYERFHPHHTRPPNRRKTRRTQRIEQWLDAGTAEQHQQITFDDESDDSSVNENYDVESLPDSIPDQLT